MDVKIPQALVIEHTEMDAELEKAIKEGGQVGTAAMNLREIKRSHSEHEEKFALPPLGLLRALSTGMLDDEMAQASIMADDLKAEMPRMLIEHRNIYVALDKLAEAAKEEGKTEYIGFVHRMRLHLEEEEEVYYPAALLIGEYLKIKLATLVKFSYP
jgi:hypothetical protein